MKIVIEQQTFLDALDHLKSVVERRNTIPILSNVMLTAGNAGLTIVATDLDIELTETVAAAVETGGKVTVQAHLLHDIVRKFPKGSQVSIATTESGLDVTCGRSISKVSVLPHEDFPSMSWAASRRSFVIAAQELRTIIGKVSMAMSTEETRYYLNGFYLHGAGEKLRAVATDGHRLVRHEVNSPDGAADLPGVIVPRKTAGEVYKLLDGETGDVTVSVSDTKIKFEFGNVALLSKLIDGNFPPYERVIPQNNANIMSMATTDLTAAVDRCGSMLHKTGALRMAVKAGTTHFSAINPGVGTSEEDVDAEYAGPDMDIGFNRSYLGELAGGIIGDRIVFTFGDASTPALITDPGNADTLYVLMPMRI